MGGPNATRPTGRAALAPRGALENKGFPGTDLLSQMRQHPVPSALEGVTVLFGMGSGGVPPLEAPGKPCDNVTAAGSSTGSNWVRAVARRNCLLICQGPDPAVPRPSAHGSVVKPSADAHQSTSTITGCPCLAALPGTLPGALPASCRERTHLEGGFALICCQRLSGPDIATRHLPRLG